EQQELSAFLAGYLYGNAQVSRDTGKALSLDVGFRYEFVRPYVSLEYFDSDDCTPSAGPGGVTAAQCVQAHTGDSRNARFGLGFYINKSQNHVLVEFSPNPGQSAFGAQSIAAASAHGGYSPFVPARQTPLASL